MFDELRQGAHGGALGDEGGELVAVFEEEFDLEFGIGGVIFGPARGKRFAVLGHGERIDGKEHEEIILAQRGHDGPFIEFQAHGDGLAVEPRAQGLDPRVDRFRTVFEAQKLPVARCQRLVSRYRVWHPPSRGQQRPQMLRVLVASCVISQRVVQWCQGTCLLALCEGIIESR